MISDILVIIILVLLIPTIYAAIIGAPIAVTSKLRVRQIIKTAEIKPNDKFYELGTGTGRVIVSAAKFSKAMVVGFELSPIFYLITLFNLKIHGVKKYKIFLKDFFSANLENADVVFCFLMPRTIERLKKKLEKELKPGTRVISYAFEIKNWTPYAIIQGNRKLPVYFYKKL